MTNKKDQNFDRNLRGAMFEIDQICRKRNIAASVVLASKTHTEFALMVDRPTWSLVSFEPHKDGGQQIRVKGSVATDKEKMVATAHMIFATRDLLINLAAILNAVAQGFEKQVPVEHKSIVGATPDAVPSHLQEVPPETKGE